MFEKELTDAIRGIRPTDALRARVLEAASNAAAERSLFAAGFERRLSELDGVRLDSVAEGGDNPDYYKNMITRFTLCDPDDAEHLQGLILSVSK